MTAPKLDGVPTDGDVDVPTDVLPLYAAPFMHFDLGDVVPGRFTITARNGTVMLAWPRLTDETHYELTPEGSLQPNTKYVLHAEFEAWDRYPAGSDELEFTTGDGPLETPPETPSARLIHYDLDRAENCGLPWIGTCISLGDDRTFVIVTFADDRGGMRVAGHRGSFFSPIDVPPNFPTCAQIRARALNGTLSDPIELCASTAASLAFHDTDRLECTTDGLEPLPPSEGFVPVSTGASKPDAGSKPPATAPSARDAGARIADAQVTDAQPADAEPIIEGGTQGPKVNAGGCGCSVANGSARVPVALLLVLLLALRRRALCAALACACVLAVASDAYACGTTPPKPKLDGVPADGDVDVPTDVLPYYAYVAGHPPPDGDMQGRFTITAEDGTAMLARPRTADQTNYELVPDDALQPNTKYVLHAEFEESIPFPAGEDDVHFTTGDGPVTKPPETPGARIIQYTLDTATCGVPRVGTCVSVGDDRANVVIDIIATIQGVVTTVGSRGSFFSPINVARGLNECVEVRTRALNGVLSDPLKLCEDTFTSLEIHDTDSVECTSKGLKPLPPSPAFEPASSEQPEPAPDADAPDAGKPPGAGQPISHDVGSPSAHSEPADAQVADAQPTVYIEGKHPRSDSGCAAARGGAPVPIAVLLLCVLALRRRTRGG